MRYFSSPGSLRRPMDSDGDDPKGPGFPIRISTDQSSFAAPHGFSQRTTSFIASRCQGIHQTPLRRLIDPTSNGQRPPATPFGTSPSAAAPDTGPRQHFVTQSARPDNPTARSRSEGTTSATEPLRTGLARSSRYSPCPTATTDTRGMPPPASAGKGDLCLRDRAHPDKGRHDKRWWAREDLNFRPHAYQARALTN